MFARQAFLRTAGSKRLAKATPRSIARSPTAVVVRPRPAVRIVIVTSMLESVIAGPLVGDGFALGLRRLCRGIRRRIDRGQVWLRGCDHGGRIHVGLRRR